MPEHARPSRTGVLETERVVEVRVRNRHADTIVVGGRVYGKLQAGSRIVVHQTATIEGDLIAPAISLAEGANVQGRVETAARTKKVLSLAS